MVAIGASVMAVSDFLGPAVYSTNGVPPYYSNVGVAQGDGPTEGACEVSRLEYHDRHKTANLQDIFASYTYQGTSLSEWKERLTRSYPQSAFFVDPNLKAVRQQ